MRNTTLNILGLTVAMAIAMSATPAFARHHHRHHHHGNAKAKHPHRHGVNDNVKGCTRLHATRHQRQSGGS